MKNTRKFQKSRRYLQFIEYRDAIPYAWISRKVLKFLNERLQVSNIFNSAWESEFESNRIGEIV